MRLLLNGCSFSANYYLANHLARQLGLDDCVSLAIGGSSNRRIIRSTLEHLESNDDIGFVLLGLSFIRRAEGSFLLTQLDKDNWVQYGPSGIQGYYVPPGSQYKNDYTNDEYEQYVQSVYKFDVDIKYIDQLLCDLTMLSGYLNSKNIPHLFFNFCELRYPEYFNNTRSVYKQMIQSNKRIVPLDQFVGNLFLRDHNAKYNPVEERWKDYARHYDGDEYIHMNNYFMQYMRTNNLV
jgi:hypothetical protein